VPEKNHLTIDQVHRITDIIEKTLENKGMCSAVSLALHKLATEYGIETYFIN
jgi:hypothetical protein